MAEMVRSAVVQETTSQILSGMVQKYEQNMDSNANRNLERLEMAHIRLQAALETSIKWQITDASLLRWRRMLRRAAQECDDTVQKCKQRILEDEQMEQEVKNSPFPKRIAHATKSFFFSIFSIRNNELTSSIVKRFEWFAAGANEFVRFVEFGGTPRHVPFDSLVKNLSAGMELHLKFVNGNKCPLFELWLVPNNTAEHGIVASLIFVQKDGNRPKGTIFFSVFIQLSETTDIVGISIKCLNLFAPHLKCEVENIRKELTQLHTQNFFWVPSVNSCQREHWDNFFSLGSQWFRPNPFCCRQHNRHKFQCTSSQDILGLSDITLEPVIGATVLTFIPTDIISLQDAPYLKAAVTFAPHASLEGIVPANNSSAILAIEGEKRYCLQRDITLEKLKEIMLPKAIDYFCQNADATVYQMIWQSEHGSVLIHFEKERMSRPRTGGARKRKLLQGQEQGTSGTSMISRLLDLWGAHMPIRLRSFFTDWMQKQKEDTICWQKSHGSTLDKPDDVRP
ncbi:hypothetical protein EJB05_09234, partial [Eragrostis curvula]